MAHIEELAADCMRDLEEEGEEDEGLEEDAELLVRLPGWCPRIRPGMVEERAFEGLGFVPLCPRLSEHPSFPRQDLMAIQ